MKIINTNSTYRVYPDDLKTFDSLPVGVYKACFSKFTGFFLEKHPDVEIKEKIYGHHKEKVAKILSSFEKFDRNLGVIFSGDKGIGKSMAAKLMTQTSLEKGIPVILVNEYLPGISDLLNDIEQEVVVIFDEFDKTYESSSGRCGDRDSCEDDRQTEFLTLLDGFGVGKKLYVTTALAPIVGTLQTITTDLGYLKKGTQATCRNDLEDIFKKAEKDGYCSNEDKQRFEQTYQAYHSLGKNGVMDAKHAKILGLPDKKPVRHTTPKRRRLTEGED